MFSKKAEDSGLQRGEHWPEAVDSRQAARPPAMSAARQRMANSSGKCMQLAKILCQPITQMPQCTLNVFPAAPLVYALWAARNSPVTGFLLMHLK